MIDTDKYEGHLALEYEWAFTEYMGIIDATHEERCATDALLNDAPLLLAEVKRLRKTLACIAFSPDDPEWVSEKLDELEVDSDTWKRWHE